MMAFTYGYDDPYIDVVLLRDEVDSSAYRSRIDENDYNFNPFAPKNLVWALGGAFGDVVGELLALPRPGEPGAPSLLIATPSSLWLPPGAHEGRAGRSLLEI
ncbi:hypothetical protein NLX83_10705 [Allokutzneria sp. A3M-2-11 16]|uniref:hypothetical protein n=1 Tax=Allokutzneria sp. A3M-2-11 16 TaxID=2962043 RepID=UPI0020B6EE94|nr:hypothetical protein [Allokutzneria sp. A3M-2-11 16]MCP3799728.1 hypothetical protein [Allokutzneria sp. A3M-2-11 16]